MRELTEGQNGKIKSKRKATKSKSVFEKLPRGLFKEMFKALSKAILHDACGKWEEVGSDAVETLSTIGLSTDPRELAFIFIRHSITEALFDLVGKIASQQLIETENNSDKLVDNLISPSQPERFTLIASFSIRLQTYPWLVRFNPSHTSGSKALE